MEYFTLALKWRKPSFCAYLSCFVLFYGSLCLKMLKLNTKFSFNPSLSFAILLIKEFRSRFQCHLHVPTEESIYLWQTAIDWFWRNILGCFWEMLLQLPIQTADHSNFPFNINLLVPESLETSLTVVVTCLKFNSVGNVLWIWSSYKFQNVTELKTNL